MPELIDVTRAKEELGDFVKTKIAEAVGGFISNDALDAQAAAFDAKLQELGDGVAEKVKGSDFWREMEQSMVELKMGGAGEPWDGFLGEAHGWKQQDASNGLQSMVKTIHCRDRLPFNDKVREEVLKDNTLSNIDSPVGHTGYEAAWRIRNRLDPYVDLVEYRPTAQAKLDIPELTGAEFVNEAATPDPADVTRGTAGTIAAGATETIGNWTLRFPVSEPLAMDNPELLDEFALDATEKYFKLQGDQIHAKMASQLADADARRVKIASTLANYNALTTANAVKKLVEASTETPDEYIRGGAEYFVAPSLYGKVQSVVANTGLSPEQIGQGVRMLAGYPIRRMDTFPAAALNKYMGFFGQPRLVVRVYNRETLVVRVTLRPEDGTYIVFCRGRFLVYPLNEKGATGIQIAA